MIGHVTEEGNYLIILDFGMKMVVGLLLSPVINLMKLEKLNCQEFSAITVTI